MIEWVVRIILFLALAAIVTLAFTLGQIGWIICIVVAGCLALVIFAASEG